MLATVWHLALKIANGGTTLAWQTLAQLANEGDVSGIEEWIEACRKVAPEHERTLRWVEDNLHRLNLPLLQRYAEIAVHRFA